MNFTHKVLSVSTVALALAALPALAKDVAGASAGEPAYNPATITQFLGTVAAVREVPAGNPLAGVHLTVKTKTGSIDVYVGPGAFLKMLKTSFPVGYEIEVTGSKVSFGTSDIVLASYVSVSDAIIKLRDGDGTPVWNHWGVSLNS